MYEYITTELPQVLQQFPELDVKKVLSFSIYQLRACQSRSFYIKSPR